MIKSVQGWFVIGATMVLLPFMAAAQEASPGTGIGTSTPPELRDFRLDTPAPKPAPQTPAPVAPTQAEPSPRVAPAETPTDRPTTTRRDAPPLGRSPVRQEQRPESPVTSITAPRDAESAATAPAVPAIAPDPVADTSAIQREPDSKEGASRFWEWWMVAAATATLFGLAIAWLFIRRRRRVEDGEDVSSPVQQPSPPARLDRPRPSTPAAPKADTRPGQPLFAEFRPESAQLSIASLAVTGKLILINQGMKPIEDLLMRSHMISAQTGQAEAIAAFHDSTGTGSPQPIGNIAPNERIEAVIEIRLPRSELSSFRWTEREFVAPIILINLSGKIDEQPIAVRLSQLIGREGAGDAARMKPLAIDRGPKRFTEVSARPVLV